MHVFLVLSSSPDIQDVNDWFPAVEDGHFGREGQGIHRKLLERDDGDGS